MQRHYGPQLARRTDRLPVNHRLPPWRRRAIVAEPAVAAGPDVRDPRLARLEAVLFAAEEPLAARRLAALAELTDAAEVRRLVDRLTNLLEAEGSAFRVEDIAGGVQLLTGPEFHPWLVRLRQTAGEPKLSGALLETLAIIAYRQPIMRADLEAVRGVHCGDALRQLIERPASSGLRAATILSAGRSCTARPRDSWRRSACAICGTCRLPAIRADVKQIKSNYPATTGFRSSPTPSISTSTSSPGFKNTGGLPTTPTPGGVPVKIKSPGSSVTTCDRYAISCGISKIELARIEILHRFAVQSQTDGQGVRVRHFIGRDQMGPGRSEGIKRLADDPLLLLALEFQSRADTSWPTVYPAT